MARMARVVVPGCPHLVTHRCRGRDIFVSTADRRRFLELLAAYGKRSGLKVRAYSLMPDRVSLVAVPRDRKSLSVALKFALRSYSKYVRKKGRRRGRVWKGRFSSCPVDPAYCRQVMLHVERLPVRAGLAGRAEQYLWSSAAAHAGKRKDPLVSGGAEANWAAWLRQPEGSRVSAAIERSARTGRPLGSNEFVVALERRLGRRLRPRKPGPRPKKKR